MIEGQTLDIDGFMKEMQDVGVEAIIRRLKAINGENDYNFLLLVDQFEEIFRFDFDGSRSKDTALFVSLILSLSEQHEPPLYVIMAMRSDFIGECVFFEGLPEALNRSFYLIPRMTGEEIREIIEIPPRMYDAHVSPEFSSRLLADVAGHHDDLPLLQHALRQTWSLYQQSGDDTINVGHYLQAGTLASAISQHAEEVFAAMISDKQRELAQRIFQVLTQIDTYDRMIRRPVRIRDIVDVTGASFMAVCKVINHFNTENGSFLITPAHISLTTDTYVDIIHESLIRQWARLRQWVEEEADSSKIYLRIVETALLYREGNAGLWRDPDLSSALDWLEIQKPTRAWAQLYHPEFELAMGFIEKSKLEAEREWVEKKRRLEREWVEKRKSRVLVFSATLIILAFLVTLWIQLFT